MRKILQENFANLRDATSECLKGFSSELFSCGLITNSVRDSPTFNDIFNEFIAGMKTKKDRESLMKYWQSFLNSLYKQGGPAEGAANHLAEKWQNSGNQRKCHIS